MVEALHHVSTKERFPNKLLKWFHQNNSFRPKEVKLSNIFLYIIMLWCLSFILLTLGGTRGPTLSHTVHFSVEWVLLLLIRTFLLWCTFIYRVRFWMKNWNAEWSVTVELLLYCWFFFFCWHTGIINVTRVVQHTHYDDLTGLRSPLQLLHYLYYYFWLT